MPRADRLLDLSAYRCLLRRSGFATLGDYRTAADHPELSADAPAVARLVAAGDPNVIAALFGPLEWSAGPDDADPDSRGMTIAWNAEDPDGERLARVALRAALRGRRSHADPKWRAAGVNPVVPTVFRQFRGLRCI
jgi:hypothetical protein